jgi:hypothetical protein
MTITLSELAILDRLTTQLSAWPRIVLADASFGADHPAYPVAGVLGHLRDLPGDQRMIPGSRQIVTQEYGIYVACLRATDGDITDPIASARSDLINALMGHRFAGTTSLMRYVGCTLEHTEAQVSVHLYRFSADVEYVVAAS